MVCCIHWNCEKRIINRFFVLILKIQMTVMVMGFVISDIFTRRRILCPLDPGYLGKHTTDM